MNCPRDPECQEIIILKHDVAALRSTVGEAPNSATGTEGHGMAKQVDWLVDRARSFDASVDAWVKRVQISGIVLAIVVSAITIISKLGCASNPIKKVEIHFKNDGGAPCSSASGGSQTDSGI